MSVRSELAEALETALPDFTVIDHDDDPTIVKTTVMVYVDTVDRASTRGARTYSLSAVVITPKQVNGDGDLEDALEDVLEAIDLWDFPATWSHVERAVWAETYPAFKITVTGNYQHVYSESEE